MALTVEDGTGLANADSYVSEADADTYVTAYEPEGFATWNAATSGAKEVALRKATQWLDIRFADRWKGIKKNSTMSLDWPRSGVCIENVQIASTELPTRLTQATIEAAVRFLSGELQADVAADSQGIRRERSELAVLKEEIEYAGQKSTQKSTPKLLSLVGPLITGGTGNRLSLA